MHNVTGRANSSEGFSFGMKIPAISDTSSRSTMYRRNTIHTDPMRNIHLKTASGSPASRRPTAANNENAAAQIRMPAMILHQSGAQDMACITLQNKYPLPAR